MFKKIALSACAAILLSVAAPAHAAPGANGSFENGGKVNGSFENGSSENGGFENGTSLRGAKAGHVRQDAPVRLNVLGVELPPPAR